MRFVGGYVLASLLVLLAACGGTSGTPAHPANLEHPAVLAPKSSVPAPAAQQQAAKSVRPSKVLMIIEENHSYTQMRSQMPYLSLLATKYAYPTNYTAITHPSLPNYLALAGGSTFGVKDDSPPASHKIPARSMFDQAIHAGKTAKTYAESMPGTCALTSTSSYAVKHNPWAYFVNSRGRCRNNDVPLGSPVSGALHKDVVNNTLPNIGMVIPNLCHDAHDCPLAVANTWLTTWLPQILASNDFTSGRLTVVITADEDDYKSGNHILTVVVQAGLSHQVVKSPLNHYSLLGYVDHVLRVPRLGAATRGFARAFGL